MNLPITFDLQAPYLYVRRKVFIRWWCSALHLRKYLLKFEAPPWGGHVFFWHLLAANIKFHPPWGIRPRLFLPRTTFGFWNCSLQTPTSTRTVFRIRVAKLPRRIRVATQIRTRWTIYCTPLKTFIYNYVTQLNSSSWIINAALNWTKFQLFARAAAIRLLGRETRSRNHKYRPSGFHTMSQHLMPFY